MELFQNIPVLSDLQNFDVGCVVVVYLNVARPVSKVPRPYLGYSLVVSYLPDHGHHADDTHDPPVYLPHKFTLILHSKGR